MCAAHEAVVEASSREATMVVAGFSLCEACGGDALAQILAESRKPNATRRSPGQVVVDEMYLCASRGFL